MLLEENKIREIRMTLIKLINLFNDYNPEIKYKNIAFYIFVRLLCESGLSEIDSIFLKAEKEYKNRIDITFFNTPIRMEIVKEASTAVSILKQAEFKNVDPKELLLLFDNLIHKKLMNYREPKIPRWLSDFMIKLANIKSDSKVANIHNSNGEILSAAILNNSAIKIFGESLSLTGLLWSFIEQILLNKSNGLVEGYVNIQKSKIVNYKQNDAIFSHVISAPYFGNLTSVNGYLSIKSYRSEDIYLQLAYKVTQENGRIVMLIPDGLLFAEGERQSLRNWIYNNTEIRAIISLERGVLKPYSEAKTNILVLDKIKNPNNYNLFMSKIYFSPDSDTFNCEEILELSEILDEFTRWDKYKKLYLLNNSWVVSKDEINLKNLTVNRYMPMEFLQKEIGTSQYNIFQLKDISTEISNGKTFKKQNDGRYKIFGSPVVRRLNLDKNKMMRSNEQPARTRKTIQGDILVNAIGEQIGETALVTVGYDGYYVGQHVICITPNIKIVLPEYLSLIINSDYVQNQIKQRIGGTVIKTITKNRITDILIPVPDVEIQHEILNKYKSLIGNVEDKKEELKGAESILKDFISNLASNNIK